MVEEISGPTKYQHTPIGHPWKPKASGHELPNLAMQKTCSRRIDEPFTNTWQQHRASPEATNLHQDQLEIPLVTSLAGFTCGHMSTLSRAPECTLHVLKSSCRHLMKPRQVSVHAEQAIWPFLSVQMQLSTSSLSSFLRQCSSPSTQHP